MDISGLIDGYYSYNANRPSDAANGQVNDLYNFNDKTDQFNLSEARLTLNHDPDPVGAHVDVFYGRTNTLINGGSHDQGDYIEQAFLSLKPPKAKGFELDFGKFVTSAGAEVIESKDNWNYSRSILFAWAIPYYHFGLRTSMPVSKVDTIGVQVVNGWNNVDCEQRRRDDRPDQRSGEAEVHLEPELLHWPVEHRHAERLSQSHRHHAVC